MKNSIVLFTSFLRCFNLYWIIWNFWCNRCINFYFHIPNHLINKLNTCFNDRFGKKWLSKIRCIRTSTSEAERWWPIWGRYTRKKWKIDGMVSVDRRLKLHWNVEAISVSHSSVVSIVNDLLGMRTIRALFAHNNHKHNRVRTWKICLALFNCQTNEFLHRFITVVEIWIHHNTPLQDGSDSYQIHGNSFYMHVV